MYQVKFFLFDFIYLFIYLNEFFCLGSVAASHCPSKDVNGLCDCQSTICRYDQFEYLDPNTCTCVQTLKKRSLVKRDIGDQSIEGGKSFIAVSARGQLADGERKKRHAPKGPKVRVGRKVNI